MQSKRIAHPFYIAFLLFCCPLAAMATLKDADVLSFKPAGRQQVALYWKNDAGKTLGSLGNLKQYVESKKSRLVFAMNAGMYMEDRTPVGLFIQHGATLHKLNTAEGSGNFYLQPNGVFYITDDRKGHIVTTKQFKYGKGIRYATQSGPMLVIDGAIHPAFRKGSAISTCVTASAYCPTAVCFSSCPGTK